MSTANSRIARVQLQKCLVSKGVLNTKKLNSKGSIYRGHTLYINFSDFPNEYNTIGEFIDEYHTVLHQTHTIIGASIQGLYITFVNVRSNELPKVHHIGTKDIIKIMNVYNSNVSLDTAIAIYSTL